MNLWSSKNTFCAQRKQNNHSCLPCQSPLHVHKSITTHVCDAAVDAVFGWTIPLNMFQCTGQAFMSASVYLQRACFRPKHDIIKTWTETEICINRFMFTYANVVHRERLKLFACFEQGSINCVFLLRVWQPCWISFCSVLIQLQP